MNYLTTIFLIGLLIFIHELGHLLAARLVGIPIARFSIGFGPVLWRAKRGATEYCWSLVPLGGYVLPQLEDEAAFFNIPPARRIVMWLGGPAANFVAAFLCIAVLEGMHHGWSLTSLFVAPGMELIRVSRDFLAALPTILMHPSRLSGVVGIVAAGGSVMADGIQAALRFALLLNVNLAIFNLLPMPPLDGGKIVAALLEKLHPKFVVAHQVMALAGLAVLLGLMVYTTVLDMIRLA